MLGSAILDVAIGLVFVFLLVSIIVTTVNEFVAALLASRAKWLKKGVERLLGSTWAAKLYEHPMIEGTALAKSGPSYIASRTFSDALLDLVGTADKDLLAAKDKLTAALQAIPSDSDREAFIAQLLPAVQAMSDAGGTAKAMADDIASYVGGLPSEGFDAATAITALKALLVGTTTRYFGSIVSNIDDPTVQRVLKVLLETAGGDLAKFKENVEIWFNNTMDRVAGWYKRKSQWVIALIALIVTLAMNVDALLIAQHLNTFSALRDTVVAQAKAYSENRDAAARGASTDKAASGSTSSTSVDAQLDKLNLPIGWYRPSLAVGNEPLAAFRRDNHLVLQPDGWMDIVGFHLVGWLITMLAASLGAPFWFDVLNKFMSVRAAGKAPEERPKSPKEVPVPLEPGQSPREADQAVGGR